MPGLVCFVTGVAFLALVPGDGDTHGANRGSVPTIPVARPLVLFLVFGVAIIAGGMTFNVTTIALPRCSTSGWASTYRSRSLNRAEFSGG